ncbi:MAG: hypothetical protein LIO74_12035 [Ruminococcus sp.]|nr:hypothetical protein [Ruminococcus sp.]
MLKKTITYTDYNGTERTEDYYFNLSKAELIEMQATASGGLEEMYQKIIAEQNIPEIYRIFKEIILKSYGEKSVDGKRFVKSEEMSTAFTQTEAFSELISEFMTDPEKASEFANGIISSIK